MRVRVVGCLMGGALLSLPCTGGAAVGSTSPAAAETKSLQQAAPVQTKLTQVGVLCPTENAAAMQLYNDALDLQHKGHITEAEAAYRRAIELDPGYCDAMDNLGQMLRQNGATEQAITWYQHSIAVKPDNAVAHQNLAVAYKVQGETGKAAAEFQWLITHDPENPEGYYGLGDIRLSAGDAKAAVEPLKRAEALYLAGGSPLLADARYQLAVAFYSQKAYRQAREYLLLIYPDRENDPDVNYLLGLCYLDPESGDRGRARTYLHKAQDLGVNVSLELLQDLGN